MDYKTASRNFIEKEKQFHLGVIPTEQSNPLTRGLSARIKKDTADGVRMILSADQNIARVARDCFKSEAFQAMVTDIRRCIDERRTVLLSSVGASGRLALQLDATWRKFWLDLIAKLPVRAQELASIAQVTYSIMTGGDRASVQSVENFEDYMTFGARQVVDAGVGPGDVVLALAECGLSASINGSAVQADESGCNTYYLFCNPQDILSRHLDRARAVFEHERIVKLPLFVGSMAIAGSTRMQVTTVELLVVGAALELAAWSWLEANLSPDELTAVGRGTLTAQGYADAFEQLTAALSSGDAVSGLAKAIDYEADTYAKGGLITYCTHEYLQDIFTDTTERQPTFTLPPYRRTDNPDGPLSWAYAKDPLYPSSVAWQHVLRRPIKGLDWTGDDYRQMGASQQIIDNPPAVTSKELTYYLIGNEDDPSRYSRHPANLVMVDVDDSAGDGTHAWYQANRPRFDGGIALRLGEMGESRYADEIRIPVALPHTIMALMPHLMVKLVFNLLSTAAMAKIGRVWSNWMIQVLPTNKKLIDRSTRIIAELAQIPYEKANEEFFKSYLGRPKGEEYRESYVVETLKRLGFDPDQDA